MFKLHAVQAAEGDCLVMEYGSAGAPRYALIDGGPSGTYAGSLKQALANIVTSRKLELLMVSHVDDDHVLGLLELLAAERGMKKPNRLKIGSVWYNAFSATLPKDLFGGVQSLLGTVPVSTAAAIPALVSIDAGSKLTGLLVDLELKPNKGLGTKLISTTAKKNELKLTEKGPTFRVIGPGPKQLAALEKKWRDWLAAHKADIAKGIVSPLASDRDRSPTNKSSLMFLVQFEGKKLLLTGDGRSEEILEGLRDAKLLDSNGRLHVEVLKMPHHGSMRNIDLAFLKTVTADAYVISADGKHGNPDLQTLEWILEAARADGRSFELYVTNEPKTVRDFVSMHPPAQSGYRLHALASGQPALTVTLA